MFRHIFNTIIDKFCPIVIENKITMNILLSRSYALNHEGSIIGVSFVTALSFFSLITEISNRNAKPSLHLSVSLGSAVESKYKSPFYKLWQSFTKNKSSNHNNRAVNSDHKKHSHIQPVSVSYKSYLKKVKLTENYMTQSGLMNEQKGSWFGCNLSFCNLNDRRIGWWNMFYFVLHVCAFEHMLRYIKNVFKNNGAYNHKKQNFRLYDLTALICSNVVWRHLEKIYSIDVSYNKSFSRVYCQ
ncbi:hypothetical protein MCW_01155 [Cardidatus Bartonella washoeensis 085-0475]|uniref:Uncharacterized protein n=1 Tax=Cardidatus Bartonella washoeensis 085-0475 TaxID=1094564 RepID=J1JJS6_9HYPH|nr:hypothetical protein MCW_01155 [Bartonella washoeensis 085-0475]